jgi:SAM-dependent methyltransferase
MSTRHRARRATSRALKMAAIAADIASRRLTPAGLGELTLRGDRELEWTFCQARLADGPGSTLDFGSDIGVLALAAALRGHDVVALDRLDVPHPVAHSRVTKEVADILDRPLADREFDQIVNCSSVEHVGLAGRYGSSDAVDGDIEAMTILAERLRPGGRHILTVPVGRDRICAPQHRIYGKRRLPRLLEPYQVVEQQFWRRATDAWRETDGAVALDTEGSASFYSLGLFVLTR